MSTTGCDSDGTRLPREKIENTECDPTATTNLLKDVVAIGLDWSGTICDDRDAAFEACNRVYEHYGIKITEFDSASWGRHPSASPTADWQSKRRDADALISDPVRRARFLSVTREEYIELWTKTYRSVLECCDSNIRPKLIPGAIDAIRTLLTAPRMVAAVRRGIQPHLFVLSSCPDSELHEEIVRLGLDGELRDVIGGTSDKGSVLKAISNRISVASSRRCRLAYVGDTSSDVMAAKAAGAVSIAVTSGYHAKETLEAAEPDCLFSDVAKFATMFSECQADVE